MTRVTIAGGGPGGASAAIAAIAEGGAAVIYEPSHFPRHKVCGEFLSPEMAPLLERLGVAEAFFDARPAQIRRMEIHLGAHTKSARLPEPALGLSRYRFDHLLLEYACSRGAVVVGSTAPTDCQSRPLIVAHGRRENQPRGSRLFGFKAHFTGPASDAVELFFHGRAYTGLNAIEDGLTNVCGIAPEPVLGQYDFDVDAFVASCPALKERLAPLARATKWFTTGPLVFGNRFWQPDPPGIYRAGDALSFVDPFTGIRPSVCGFDGRCRRRERSQNVPQDNYQMLCRKMLGRPFGIAALLRGSMECGWAERLMWLDARATALSRHSPEIRNAFPKTETGEHSEEDAHRWALLARSMRCLTYGVRQSSPVQRTIEPDVGPP